MAFNRDRNSRGGDRGGFRPGFNDRGNHGPVDLHKAICDNCGKECEVPFRPTSGKPVFCSNCFENKRGSDSGRFESRAPERSEERQMFDAVCADCGNACQVPFRPSGDKPVFCNNCFGEKKNAGGNNGGGKDNFEELNAKLDKILSLLSPTSPVVPTEEIVTEETEKPVKAAKKKTSSKKA